MKILDYCVKSIIALVFSGLMFSQFCRALDKSHYFSAGMSLVCIAVAIYIAIRAANEFLED